jgi:glycosyltransferase involved in cell wall biosynthesis
MTRELWFVAPPFDGPISGGTLYNREIATALLALGAAVKRLDPEAARQSLAAGATGLYVVDTLYLRELAELRSVNHARRPLALLCHYLPSLVAKGEALTFADLEHAEQLALGAADAFVAPSAFMQQTIARLDPRQRPRVIIEPATLATGLARLGARRSASLCAIIVANLVPGKGVEPFLSALSRSASPSDAFELEIVGSPSADPEYAEACVRAANGDPRIRFVGALDPTALIARLSEHDLLISASRMESFGMALAEARTLGVPIAARSGGNVAAHVAEAAGGELCSDEGELALAVLSLCRNPAALARRLELARLHARPPRGWRDAAEELLAQVPRLERDAYEK